MSALGQKQHKPMSALTPKADMCSALAHVRFVPIADIALVAGDAGKQVSLDCAVATITIGMVAMVVKRKAGI